MNGHSVNRNRLTAASTRAGGAAGPRALEPPQLAAVVEPLEQPLGQVAAQEDHADAPRPTT